MSQVITLEGFTPTARFDDVPWTLAEIQEAATSDGSWTTIDTITLDPVDIDPSDPAARNLTTENGSDTPALWYRVIFVDGDGDTAQPTEPIQNIDGAGLTAGTVIGLTTLDKLRLHVLRSSSDERMDEKLAFYGEIMSTRVADYCRREFKPAPAFVNGADTADPVARIFGYDGQGALDIAPYELRKTDDLAVTLFTDRPEGEWRTLDSSEYRLSPRGGTEDGTYLGIDLPRLNRHGRDFPISNTVGTLQHHDFGYQVTVTARWGMTAVPVTVELAVLVAVDDIIDNPASRAGTSIGGYQIQPDQLDPLFDLSARGGLPRAALWALAKYRRKQRMGSIELRSHHQQAGHGLSRGW